MRSSVNAIALVIAVLAGGQAVAQQEGRQQQLDEILVVAQKKDRAENLQQVPAAITAFNEVQLDEIIFQRLDDLSYNIPNVQLEQVGTFPGVQNFSIRGQGINSSIPSVDPTVGTFVDGVYIGTTYGVVVDTWDLESIEVLRGPQGLLFGRNVTGGAILLRTRRPDPSEDTEIRLRAQATNEDRYGLSFSAAGPLVRDKLAGKLMVYYEDDQGYFKNVNPNPTFPSPPFTYFNQQPSNRDLNELKTTLARPTLVWTPTDTLELALIGELGKTEGDGAPWTVIDGNPNLAGGIPGQREGALSEFTTTIDDYGVTDLEWDQATFEINWDVGGGTLTNIAGWRQVEAFATADVDGQGTPIFTAPGNTEQKQWSNELRWSGTFNDVWDMTLGLYYLDQEIDYQESRYIQLDVDTLLGSGGTIVNFVPNWRTIAVGGEMESETWGVFWNNDIRFADDWVLTAGLRYSDEKKKASIIDGSLPGGANPWCEDVVNFNCSRDDLEGDWDYWIPKLGLQWDFAETANAYTFVTQGYRTGGFNFRNVRPSPPPPPFGYPAGPTKLEEQDTFEIGLKSQVLDDRLRMNFAYFYNDIQDIQRELNQGDPQYIVLQATINAGDVRIQGFEFEFQALATDYLKFWGSLGYLDGKYTEKTPPYDGVNPASCPLGFPGPPSVPPCLPYVGDDLPRLAPWSFALGGSWDIPLNANGLLNLRADYGYRDRNAYDDANLNYFDRQRRLAASINWYSPEDRWAVTFWGKNLLDEANWGNITSIAGLYNAGPMQRGREYGLRVEYSL